MLLTLFTNCPKLARQADDAGIDRIGVDLERIGKHSRQGKLNTWISDHKPEDVIRIAEVLKSAKLFARTNPIHPGSADEIDHLIRQGVKVLMLPYFHHVEEAARFIRLINGRAEVSLLVETAAAAVRLSEIMKLDGVHDIHIGLNDLHLSLKLNHHYELLQSEFMKHLTSQLHKEKRLFGFGGVGRYNDKTLPIPADLIYAQIAYHKSQSALVSRVFTSTAKEPLNLSSEVAKTRVRLDYWNSRSQDELEFQHRKLSELIHKHYEKQLNIKKTSG